MSFSISSLVSMDTNFSVGSGDLNSSPHPCLYPAVFPETQVSEAPLSVNQDCSHEADESRRCPQSGEPAHHSLGASASSSSLVVFSCVCLWPSENSG